MEQSKIDRINELARKARTEGLTDGEREEQQALRQEYIAAYRKSLTDILDNSYIQRPDGSKEKVRRKDS
ncbi:MAG: DUF896 domain-containing protein [Firmicutes bacterium]|nr:DUF896 domain-containing protein [Bacillota bacterium]